MKQTIIILSMLLANVSFAYAPKDLQSESSESQSTITVSGWYCMDGADGYTAVTGPNSPCPFGTVPFFVASADDQSSQEQGIEFTSMETYDSGVEVAF